MIIVKIWGGIGNQIFQYVFGQYLKFRYNTEVWYDDNSYLSTDKLRKREIDALNSDIQYNNSCLFSKYRGVKNRFFRFAFQLSPKHHFIQEGSKLPQQYNSDHIYFFQGYWQDIKYYEWLKNNEPSFNIKSKVVPDELSFLYDKINKEDNTLSVHIRRGDYFLPHNINTYGVCDVEYFEQAFSRFRNLQSNLNVYVFTDDPDWVKCHLQLEDTVTLVPNYPISQFAYIELMSLCKYHIISNSSFSWWGAVLNEQMNALVIAPKQWTKTSDKTIALDKWIKI